MRLHPKRLPLRWPWLRSRRRSHGGAGAGRHVHPEWSADISHHRGSRRQRVVRDQRVGDQQGVRQDRARRDDHRVRHADERSAHRRHQRPGHRGRSGLPSGSSTSGACCEWNPATSTATDHPIATLTAPRGIAPDGAGDLWAVAVDRLVKIKASDGTKIDDVHTGAIGGRDIVRGSDGRLWVADFGSQAIAAVGTAAPYRKQSFPTSGPLRASRLDRPVSSASRCRTTRWAGSPPRA